MNDSERILFEYFSGMTQFSAWHYIDIPFAAPGMREIYVNIGQEIDEDRERGRE